MAFELVVHGVEDAVEGPVVSSGVSLNSIYIDLVLQILILRGKSISSFLPFVLYAVRGHPLLFESGILVLGRTLVVKTLLEYYHCSFACYLSRLICKPFTIIFLADLGVHIVWDLGRTFRFLVFECTSLIPAFILALLVVVSSLNGGIALFLRMDPKLSRVSDFVVALLEIEHGLRLHLAFFLGVGVVVLERAGLLAIQRKLSCCLVHLLADSDNSPTTEILTLLIKRFELFGVESIDFEDHLVSLKEAWEAGVADRAGKQQHDHKHY